MPDKVIDKKAVERSVDAEVPYIDLEYNESKNAWESDKLKIYTDANKANEVEINILDHKKDAASGFQATLIEKTDASGNTTKVITVAGTNDIVDLLAADYSIAKGDVPGLQYKAMTDFVTKLIAENKITKADNITMVGTSLGGAITQMATATFTDIIDSAYTFNSPGAANFMATAEQTNAWGWD